jgi:hypothetical protein
MFGECDAAKHCRQSGSASAHPTEQSMTSNIDALLPSAKDLMTAPHFGQVIGAWLRS